MTDYEKGELQAAILLSSSVCQARAAHSRTVLPIVSRFASGIVVIVFVIAVNPVILIIVIVIVIIVFLIYERNI